MARRVREEHDESSDRLPDVVRMEVTINPVQWRKLVSASRGDIGHYLHGLALEYAALRDRTGRWEITKVTSRQGRAVSELEPDFSDEGPVVSFDDSTLNDRRELQSFEVSPAQRRDIQTAFEQSGEADLAIFLVHAQQARESSANVRANGRRVKTVDQRDGSD